MPLTGAVVTEVVPPPEVWLTVAVLVIVPERRRSR